ncbi:hypothetical protein LDL08_22325 [Nonomuraea glycinis]|uniref:Uncharacterized protein n=1 Tax=Nonomuraea glycinis TaxID=2047744 RepID=A0A918E6F8_9ACTN|nr:hypothetical protein [Nonomuraea glycinis]MCA2178930.1 hypothetical protein [Nonomuraea glycinis]GGP08333.1 hypothetical protein GCM10012278_39630 [Nonomuraea glycinis]
MIDKPEWSPYAATGVRLRVIEMSCCGLYQLRREGGVHLVTHRKSYAAAWQEIARGPALAARNIFRELVAQHLAATQNHAP